jgi:ribonuclease P protein component
MNPARADRRFRRANHIIRSADFATAYRKGSRARGSIMTVVVRPNGGEHTRLGLSVGKKCWRRAVRRNRVRRLFREAFRLCREELPEGIDVVMISSVPRIDPSLTATREEFLRLTRDALRRGARRRRAPREGDPKRDPRP